MNFLQRAGAGIVAVLCALAFGGCGSAPSSRGEPAREASLEVPSGVRPAPTASGRARNALVLLSGGGTPFSNHYSQYLQAKAIAGFFARNYPNEPTWTFFGYGNRSPETAELADAHHIVVRDGLELDSWVPGVLPGNRPATRESFLKALREEVLPTVRDGGTLYLFIGDHGELTDGDNSESAVTLWQFKRRSRRRDTWITDEKEILTVSELRQVLAEGIGRGQVVFCMTQCHSGGFHYLGIPREMIAPRSWFAGVPEWLRAQRPAAPLRIAGFTATDEDSVAAGCVSDPDPDRWAGYERFAPESVIGVDLMTDQRLGLPRLSLAAAHETATLVDYTIDKPRATSEQYLERWAHLIETRLSNELLLTEKTRGAVAAYHRAVESGGIGPAEGELRAKQEQFGRYTARLIEQNGATRELLLRGTRKQLEDAFREGRGGGRGGPRGGNRRGAMNEARRAWTETLRPAWKAAISARNSPLLAGAVLEFERGLLDAEDGNRNFLLPRGADEDALLNEVYWSSTYAEPQKFDRAKAEAITRWAAERQDRIVSWGKTASDPAVRTAMEKIEAAIAARAGPAAEPTPPSTNVSRRTAAERVLFYRRVLAAWEFLVVMDAKPELARLHELIAIERTSLPAPAAIGAGVASR